MNSKLRSENTFADILLVGDPHVLVYTLKKKVQWFHSSGLFRVYKQWFI